jgi:hypothetical protein
MPDWGEVRQHGARVAGEIIVFQSMRESCKPTWGTAIFNIRVRYTELSPDRFKDF